MKHAELKEVVLLRAELRSVIRARQHLWERFHWSPNVKLLMKRYEDMADEIRLMLVALTGEL